MPALKCRLFIPQCHFMKLQIIMKQEGSFIVTCYKSVLNISYQVHITIHYEQTTHLPMMHAFNRIYITVESLNMILCVTSEKSQNLTHLDLLLQCNFKLGSDGFLIVQFILRQGWMGKLGENMGSHNVNITKCEEFQ